MFLKLICLKHDMVDHMLRASFKTLLKLLIHNDPAMLKIKPLFFSLIVQSLRDHSFSMFAKFFEKLTFLTL